MITGKCSPFISIAMDKETIESLLHRLHFDDEIETFKEYEIELDLLLKLDDTDVLYTLEKMNLRLGKMMKIRNEIKNIKSRK